MKICETPLPGEVAACRSENMRRAGQFLSRLGITANYSGYHYAAYCITLAMEDPERLQLVTKWLYPDVAKKFRTTTDSVRKNIRKVIDLAWQRSPAMMTEIAMYDLKQKPGTAEFLAMVVVWIDGK